MPTCTPEAVQATGATFQQTDARGIQLARVGLLWNQNGSAGTPNTILASAVAFEACDMGQLQFCLTTLLWICDGSPSNVPALLILAESYQGTAPALQRVCETISQWIEQGSAGTPSTILLNCKLFQQLSERELTVVEIKLLENIYSHTLTPAALLNSAATNGFLKLDTNQLTMLNAYLYCQLS